MDSRPNEIRAGSWNELQQALFETAWQGAIGRFRSQEAYRGVAHEAFGLTTSLCRLGGDFASLEAHLLRNFRKYARLDNPAGDSVWSWLALGQHHGLPTRLLDWSYSPYVALHFATEAPEHMHCDGVIWCVDYVRAHTLLPEPLRQRLDEEGSDVFTIEMLAEAAPTLREFDALTPEPASDPFLLFLEPPSLDQRIVNQFALFSLLSSARTNLDDWLSTHPQAYRRIVVPAALKWEVRDKLDQVNITERVIYPGLDGLSRWLRRHYAPRPAADAAVAPCRELE